VWCASRCAGGEEVRAELWSLLRRYYQRKNQCCFAHVRGSLQTTFEVSEHDCDACEAIREYVKLLRCLMVASDSSPYGALQQTGAGLPTAFRRPISHNLVTLITPAILPRQALASNSALCRHFRLDPSKSNSSLCAGI
jgi:hypothetical protein